MTLSGTAAEATGVGMADCCTNSAGAGARSAKLAGWLIAGSLT